MQETSVPKKRKAKSKKPSRAKRRKVTAENLPKQPQKWLVLAGTKEAYDFIAHWRNEAAVTMTASLSSEVYQEQIDLGIETRSGDFAHAQEDGTYNDEASAMASFMKQGRFAAVIDFTPPFAEQISADAYNAAKIAGVAYFQYLRAPWKALPDDDWHYHDSWEALYKSVKTRHLFVAGGQGALVPLRASSEAYITARVGEPPQIALADFPPNLKIILSPPLANAHEEEALFRKIKITAVAANLSGGKDSVGKLSAARDLGLPVHLVKRPDYPDGWFDNMKLLYRALGQSLIIDEEEVMGKA